MTYKEGSHLRVTLDKVDYEGVVVMHPGRTLPIEDQTGNLGTSAELIPYLHTSDREIPLNSPDLDKIVLLD